MLRNKTISNNKNKIIDLFFVPKRNSTFFANEFLSKRPPNLTKNEQLAWVKPTIQSLKDQDAHSVNVKPNIVVYRGEYGRTYLDVQAAGGFRSRGEADSIQDHVEGIKNSFDYTYGSKYISTSIDESVAHRFSHNGTVYKLQIPKFYSPIFLLHRTSRLGTLTTMLEEEVAAFNFIPFSDVISYSNRQTGEVNINQSFSKRSYAFEVTSANIGEHSYHFKFNQDRVLLNPLIPQGFFSGKQERMRQAVAHIQRAIDTEEPPVEGVLRSLCYPEAEALSKQIDAMPESIKQGPHEIIFNCMPDEVVCPTKKEGHDETAFETDSDFVFAGRLFKEALYQLNSEKQDHSFYFSQNINHKITFWREKVASASENVIAEEKSLKK